MPRKKPNTEGIDTAIPSLGEAKIPSPMPHCKFVDDTEDTCLTFGDELPEYKNRPIELSFELAGPRPNTYFDTTKTKIAIVTCGGLCPGINDVIRAIVMEAHHNYNIAASVGIRFGLEGFIPSFAHPMRDLSPSTVADIHLFGGTVLGSSRGPQAADEIVDCLERQNINILFMIGGDGTMKAAEMIQDEVAERNLKISVIGIPKTIDNDINFVFKSFGFDTAVEKATESILCAHTEAVGAFNGIGLVKLMGRESGFIAAQATLALKEVNFVLVPEAPFELHGEDGFLAALERRLLQRRHAVIVMAEGAGQNLCNVSGKVDASGNPVLGDISQVLRQAIKEHFAKRDIPVTLKYIDPSYIIRSVPANANDRVYCGFLGQHAVHAAMAGKTGMVISKIRGQFVHLPLHLVAKGRRRMNCKSDYWRAVLESTGQLAYRRDPKGAEDICES